MVVIVVNGVPLTANADTHSWHANVQQMPDAIPCIHTHTRAQAAACHLN